ncbi:ABC transporter substrate-binding protein [Pinisolibacter aquiterrae]|uniref:ABC transporter substrate-binding protein n=1 Tax=Pinisolibacter aquiterrae TaxID=2815579 RepID=UPI001C3E85D6|nr:ABC transporter substrate-binding protein [Pinisolibacter aquiterrae]MBV5262675.1 ABC transporter substrate-binding protein [Pinisolibacter aquiterrae]MCC8236029.1 ABC transporter substrate-binding protein [Pinisolibacter aquiterrae]
MFDRRVFTAGLLAVGLATPTFAADPGVSAEEIHIGSFLPLQGGLSAGANQYRDGLESYIKWVNKNGGVKGRMIRLTVENDNYNPQQAVAAAKKLVDRDGVFAIVGTLGTSNNLAAIPYLVSRGVPLIGPLGSHPSINTPTERIVFPISPLGSSHGISLAAFAHEELGAKRIAVFYQDDQYGAELLGGVKSYATEKGLEIVATATYLPSDVDFSGQVAALSKAQPDAVVMAVVPKPGALFLREAKKVGWKTSFLAPQLMADKITRDLGGDALDGMYVNLYSAVRTMDTPVVKTGVAALAEFAPSTPPDYWAFIGMSGAHLFVTALSRIEGEPTREKLMTALESLGTYDPQLIPPVTYKPGEHRGPTVFGFARVVGGDVRLIKSWAK